METCQLKQRPSVKSLWSSVVIVLAAWVSSSHAISVPTGKVGPITPYRPAPPTPNPNAPRNPAPVVEYSQDNPEPPPLDPSYVPYSFKTLNALSGNSIFYIPLRIRNAYQENPNGFSSYYPQTPQTDYVPYKGGYNFNQKPVHFNVPIKEFDYASLKRKPIFVEPFEPHQYNSYTQSQQIVQQYQTPHHYQQRSPQFHQQPQYNQQSPQQYNQPSPQQYNQQSPQQYNQQSPQQYNHQTFQSTQQVAQQSQQNPVQNQSSPLTQDQKVHSTTDSYQKQSAVDEQQLYQDFSSQKIQDFQKQSNYPSEKKKTIYPKGQYQNEQQQYSEVVKKSANGIYPKKAITEGTANKYTYYTKQNNYNN